MKLLDIVNYSVNSLRERHMRSWLTMLGIVIGIAAVVSLLTIGQGFNEEIANQLEDFGSNTVFVAPIAESQGAAAAFGSNIAPSAGKLFEKDVERLKKIPELEELNRLIRGRATVDFKGTAITATIEGIEPGIFEKTSLVEVESGRFLVDNDQRVAVIGSTISEESFDNNKVAVNSFLEINGKKFRVIGVLKESAGGFSFSQSDTAIMVPFEDARELFKESLAEGEIGAIAAKIQDGADVDEVIDQMILELSASHKIRSDDRDFSVISPKTIQESIGSILGLVTGFLGAIAGISLIVGGVGIANSMFTSVIERTHEIGVLKAIGATESDIMKIFVFESGALGGIGGLVGTIIGTLVALAAGLIGVPVSISPTIILFGILFSIIIGLLSGFIPARRAAKLSPVDALRYE